MNGEVNRSLNVKNRVINIRKLLCPKFVNLIPNETRLPRSYTFSQKQVLYPTELLFSLGKKERARERSYLR